MSVINNVLRELDSRPSGFSPLPSSGDTRQGVSGNNPIDKRPVLLMVLLLSILLVVAINYPLIRDWWLGQQVLSQTVVPNTPTTTPIDAAMSEPVAEINQEPVNEALPPTINGLQINEQVDYLQLSLLLNRHTASYLKHNSPNRYVFFLSQGVSEIEAPDVQDNPWLNRVTFVQQDNGVEVQFDTVAGVMVETDHQVSENEYHWVVRFKKTEAELSATNEIAQVALLDRTADNVINNSSQVGISKESPVAGDSAQHPPPIDQNSEPVRVEIRPAEKQKNDRQALAQAQQMIKSGQSDKAMALLTGLRSSQVDRQARLQLIQLYQQQRMQGAYRQELAQALETYPGDIDFMLMDAQRLFADNQFLQLVQRYQQQTDNMSLNSLLAASYQRLDQHEMAVKRYQIALQQDSRQPKNWISLGISMEHLNDFESAMRAYQNALQSGPLNQRLLQFTEQRIQQLSGG